MAVDKVGICNLALGEVPSDSITDFEEVSTAAEWCARLYPTTLAYMMDLHDWKFPRARATLAQIENDRPSEWAYAYAMPDDCVQELRVLPTWDSADDTVPLFAGLALAPWAVGALTVPAAFRFLISGSTIYSNIATAVLEYINGAPQEQVFRPMFIRALILELASRLVMPVKKDRVRQGDLIKAAEVAIDRAIADELNRDDSASSYGDFINETELARQGGAPGAGFLGFGYGGWRG